jgi:hypothetical protein
MAHVRVRSYIRFKFTAKVSALARARCEQWLALGSRQGLWLGFGLETEFG